METKSIAHDRVKRAMAKIEAAQNLLGDACAELSSVCWMAPEHAFVGKLYDKVHAGWYRVRRALERKGHKIDLDDINKQALWRRATAQSDSHSKTGSKS